VFGVRLKYAPFDACAGLVAAAKGRPSLRRGSHGPAVALLQGALLDLGYPLPKSTRKTGGPDGLFGFETEKALADFQSEHGLKADRVAGPQTIVVFDSLMFKKAGPPKPPPPTVSPPPSTPDYQIGKGDPPLAHDPGSGIWGSTPKQGTYSALRASIYASLPVAFAAIGDDAAKHMKHYLDNSGNPYTIDLEGMVTEVPSARKRYEDEVAQAKEFVEMLGVGTWDIRSKTPELGYNRKDQNRNWYFAIGGYVTWGIGRAVVSGSGPGPTLDLDFEYRFYDRYNWDKGKAVTFAGITVTDKFMGEFHRQGLAQEFDCFGSFKRHFSWKKGQPLSPSQVHPAGGR